MNSQNESLINAIHSLPVLPGVVTRIGSVVSNLQSSVDDVVSALKLDPVICGKVLKLANSAYIGLPKSISSVKNAVVLLGQKRIHSLVLGTSVLSTLAPPQKSIVSLYRFWKHSITVGIIAESIARHLKRYHPIETEDVFSAGMLHDIGILVLGLWDELGLDYSVRESKRRNEPFYSVEDPMRSHTSAATVLCGHWNFPEMLSQGIVFHHTPHLATEAKTMVCIVHVADIMAHIIGFSTFDQPVVPEPLQVALDEVKLPIERLRVIADEALKNEKQIESIIDFCNVPV